MLVLSIIEKQILNHKFTQFSSTNFGQYIGLFGLYSLEGQTKNITQILNTSSLKLLEKIMKNQLFFLFGLWCDLQKFNWLFAFFFEILDA